MNTNAINLLPNERIIRKKRSIVAVRWAMVCVTVLLACGVLNAGLLLIEKDGSNILLVRAGEQRVQIQSTTESNQSLVREIQRLTAQAESVSMLERRIDWRGIIAGVAVAGDDQVHFMQIRCSAGTKESDDRVEILMNGFAESQGVARSFVVALENIGLFDQVVLEQTDRVEVNERDYVRFQIRLVIDPALAGEGSGG